MYHRSSSSNHKVAHQIQRAGRTKNLPEALRLYRKAVDIAPKNPLLYNFMIKAASDCDKVAVSWDTYKEALKNSAADEVTHFSIFSAVSKAKDLPLLKEAYALVLTYSTCTTALFNNVIKAADECFDYTLAKAAYDKIGLNADIKTHGIMIQVAGKYKDIDTATAAFNKGYAIDPSNEYLYNNLIIAAGQCGKIQIASDTFYKAVKEGAATIYSYTCIITSAGIGHRINLAWDAYCIATESKTLTTNTLLHFKMMVAAAQNGREDLLDKAYEIAKKSIKANANKEIQSKYQLAKIILLKQPKSTSLTPANCNPSKELHEYKLALEVNPPIVDQSDSSPSRSIENKTLPQAETIYRDVNSLISAAGLCKNFTLAKRVYEEAIATGNDDSATHPSMIILAHQFKDFNYAKTVYLHGVMRNHPDHSSLYTSMIRVSGYHKDFEFAQKAYLTALEKNAAHSIEMIQKHTQAGACENWSDTEQAFKQALEAKEASLITHNTMITALGHCGKAKEAEALYTQLLNFDIADNSTREAYEKACNITPNSPNQSAPSEVKRNKDSLGSGRHLLFNSCETQTGIETNPKPLESRQFLLGP